MIVLSENEVFNHKIKIPLSHSCEYNFEGQWEEMEYNYRLNLCDTKYFAVKNGQVIGHIGLQDDTVRAVYVDEGERGQGVAFSLYLAVIEDLGYLKSDDAREVSADNIWKKLKKRFPDRVSYQKATDQFIFS